MFCAVIFVVIFVFIKDTDTACHQTSGPAGRSECILIPGYNGYQWATCLPKDFIKKESSGLHYCLNENLYCYYQCMVEFNMKENGDVFQNCSCIGEESVPMYTNVSLPPWCYMPNKTDCLWYSSCYDEKYSDCSQNNTDGMIFLRSYCSTAEKHGTKFSLAARNIIDEVGVCFKIEMVKVLRPWIYYKCNEIALLSLGVVRDCMSMNDICEIDMNSISSLLVTLSEGLYGQSRYAENLSEMVRMRKACSVNSTFSDINYISVLRMEAKIGPHPNNTKNTLVLTIDSQLVYNIVHALSGMITWRRSQLSWLAWEEATPEKALENKFDIKIMLASRGRFDLDFTIGSNFSNPPINSSVFALGNMLSSGKLVSLDQFVVGLSSLDACADLQCRHIYYSSGISDADGYCPSETFEKISWWKTAAGEVDTKPCPPGYKGDATRRCSTDSKWLQPVYIDCIDILLHETTEKVKELANITDPEKASSAINNILDTVQNTTDKVNQEPLKSGDLVKTTEILENILQISDDKNAPINSQTVGNVLNSVLSPDNNEGWNEVNNEQNTQNKSAANIMGIVEDLGLLIQKELSHDETKTITRSNIEIEVSTLKHDVVFPEEANTESQIRLPDQLGLEGKFYTAVHYKTISNILPRSQNRVIGSDVMSLSFERKEIHLLKNITIKFLRNKKIDLNDPTISCGYWNFSKKSWSYDGCSLKQSDGQHATCVCNHLTNFAILMSPTDVQLSDDHLLALEIITYVGCGLSVLGCILTLLIYCIFWRYVKNEWAVILVNLCIALIIGYSVFMGAAEETGNEIVCNFITALLHYVFLVVFFLMLCEGISVVISVTVVFKTKSKLPIYLSLAWIVPVAIVGATMGITTLKGYHARRYCWLNKDNFVFLAFVGPAILIIIVNVIAIILVLRAMYSSALMANEKIRKKARAGLKCMVTLLPVLGLSWLFGVLTFNEDTIVFQYLFGITTSFQGLFIFIFHVIFNKKVHEGFRKVMHRHRSKAQSNVTSRQKSSGSHVIGSKVNSTDTTNLKDVKTSTPTKKEFRNILGINRSKAYQVTTKT